MKKEIKNFIEVETVEEANKVDLTKYTCLGIKHNKYSFKKRVKK